MITYHNTIIVKLDGKTVGTIKEHKDGWQYTPKGQKEGGKYYPSLALCKNSLEKG
jgi:hypothetical protein